MPAHEGPISMSVRPPAWLSQPAWSVVRRLRAQPPYLVRFNHPVSATAWDRRKGVTGWVASTAPVASVSIRAEAQEETEVRLVPRKDVEFHLGGQFKHQIGFVARRALGDWLGDATARTLTLDVHLADGTSFQPTLELRTDHAVQQSRYARLRPLLRCPECGGMLTDEVDALVCAACRLTYPVRRGVVDFLTRQTASEFGADATDAISSWGYDERVEHLLKDRPDGLFLDCGAGLRHQLHPRIINYEIVDYTSTDVIGVGEKLPFADASFDGVISVAVLEHVQDPFRCAAELYRVLKPGGRIFAAVPFLQPLHGYPHHYYNMTSDGLRRLFPQAEVLEQAVPQTCHPVESLRWFLLSYCRGLPEAERRSFERMTVKDIMALPRAEELARHPVPVVQALSKEACFEIASATCLTARKPG
jgi:SAM-dependent methyltransferase